MQNGIQFLKGYDEKYPDIHNISLRAWKIYV
jgi:hypothetical protein